MKRGSKKPEHEDAGSKIPENEGAGLDTPGSEKTPVDPDGIDAIRALQMIAGGILLLAAALWILRNILHII